MIQSGERETGLKTIRCIKTEGSEETEEIVVAEHIDRRKKVERRIDGFNDVV